MYAAPVAELSTIVTACVRSTSGLQPAIVPVAETKTYSLAALCPPLLTMNALVGLVTTPVGTAGAPLAGGGICTVAAAAAPLASYAGDTPRPADETHHGPPLRPAANPQPFTRLESVRVPATPWSETRLVWT